MTVTRSNEPPGDRLGKLAQDLLLMFETLNGEPETKLVVMLSDHARHVGMIGLSGYDQDDEAVEDLFRHLAAFFEANGSKLMITRIGHD